MSALWLLLALAEPDKPAFVTLGAPLRTEVRYASADNFTGAPLPGYCKAIALLHPTVAVALGRAAAVLGKRGLGLLVYDAYRPVRATRAMVEWARRTNKRWVIEQGYVATRSGHNLGTTVDLTLIDLASGKPLDMGTPWDHFGTAAHTRNATGEVLERRLLLERTMKDAGFKPLSHEWWHFSFPLPGARPRDEPIGCEEKAR